jgi:hypothetical protein
LSLSSLTSTIVISACSTQELEKVFSFTILCPAQYENTYAGDVLSRLREGVQI